ncbi:Abi family protein [Mycetocola sp. JXN-3]|uniref:Abi family protein n=1 Tax=Mycetocola sp. JXN-3 TaxID=2116510 RepID=UPI00165CEF94|nr:Abi family protein [Mycetocola sp. JXN-3]
MDRNFNPEMVIGTLSAQRMNPYIKYAGGNVLDAIALYEWNLSISGAFYESIGVVEVSVRNAIAEQLNRRHGSRAGSWLDDPDALLSERTIRDIRVARARIRKYGSGDQHGHIIAELNFGFWKYLLARRYEASLWTNCLRFSFPGLRPQRRGAAFAVMHNLHSLRNRIAHHEPIYRRELVRDADSIDRMLDWVDASVAAWEAKRSRLSRTLARRPPMGDSP